MSADRITNWWSQIGKWLSELPDWTAICFAVILVLWLFRGPLSELIPRTSRLHLGRRGFEAEFFKSDEREKD